MAVNLRQTGHKTEKENYTKLHCVIVSMQEDMFFSCVEAEGI